jgi:hypothetical protein
MKGTILTLSVDYCVPFIPESPRIKGVAVHVPMPVQSPRPIAPRLDRSGSLVPAIFVVIIIIILVGSPASGVRGSSARR